MNSIPFLADAHLRTDQTIFRHPASRHPERSETAAPSADETEAHWLLVIDHHDARIFRSDMNDAPSPQILAPAPDDHFCPAHPEDFSRDMERPDPNCFFEPVAEALQAAGQILIFGSGTGTSCEMDQFIAWLKLHHPEQAARIVGSLVVDEHPLTEAQLLAKAQAFHADHALRSCA